MHIYFKYEIQINLQELTLTCQDLISGFCVAPGMTQLTREAVQAMPVLAMSLTGKTEVWMQNLAGKKTFQVYL